MKRVFLRLCAVCLLTAVTALQPKGAEPSLPAMCEHCKVAVTWQPLTEADGEDTILPEGHYYLDFAEGIGLWKEKSVPGKTCLYLNGKTLKGAARAFYVSGELTLLGQGTVTAPGPATKTSGGTIEVAKRAVLNLYGGTLTSCLPESGTTNTVNGGAVNVQGSFHMYGGTVRDGLSNNTGSNVFVTITGQFFAHGGTVEGDNTTGGSVVTRGKVQLDGDPRLQIIWLFPNVKGGGPALEDMLTVRSDFSGEVGLDMSVTYCKEGVDIGSASGGFSGTMKLKGSSFVPVVYDGQLLLWNGSPVMALGEEAKPFQCVSDACAAAERVVLMDSVTEDVTVEKTVLLDLNGHSLAGSVSGSGRLLCMDSATDDYTVADGIYGTLPDSLQVQAREGYLMLREADKVSFHRLELQITGMALRTEDAGIYFTAVFFADEAVQKTVSAFGLTASATGDPEAYPQSAVSTVLDPSAFGKGIEYTSTVIRNILRPELSQGENAWRAAIPVYARAYIQLEDGTYLYSSCKNRSLQQQMEYIDRMWSATTALQQSKLVDFYRSHETLMEGWDLPKLRSVRENLGQSGSSLEALQTLQARRDEVERYMRYQTTVLWQVSEPITYSFKSNSGDPEVDADNYINTFSPGEIFSGLPYTHGSSNAETFTFLAPKNAEGVHTFAELPTALVSGGGGYAENSTARIGNNCADSVFAAWGRVASSIRFPNSFNMTPYYGCIPVGGYETVAENVVRYPTATAQITKANGEAVMYRAYSQMQKGDAMTLTVESGAGHAILVSQVQVVLNNGQIDGKKSYILYHDQSSKYYNRGETRYDEQLGKNVRVVGGCDNKYTFLQLYTKGFLPVTCKELIDPAPLEQEWVRDSAVQRTRETFFDGAMVSNYRLATVTVGISDALGNPLQQCTRFVPEAEMHRFEMSRFTDAIEQAVLQGSLDLDALPPGSYSYVISCRLYTGRELAVCEGVFQVK